MLISLTVENWLSFRNASTLSLRASRERVKAETIHHLPKKYGTAKVLPLAGIYGPNAAGKTALFEAMVFVRQLIVRGSNPNEQIRSHPFCLDNESAEKPTTVKIEFLVDEHIYRYTISINAKGISKETLIKVLSKSEATIFSRGDTVEFSNALNTELSSAIIASLPPNQSFINAAVKLGNEDLKPIFNWFANSLRMISLDTSFKGYSKMLVRDDFMKFADEILQTYAGIDGIDLQEVKDNGVKEDVGQIVQQHVENSDKPLDGLFQVVEHRPYGNSYFFVEAEGGTITRISRMAMRHKLPDGSFALFDIRSESAGTQRLIDLMPAFFDLESSSNDSEARVYFIDEIDRSFHTAMTYGLIKRFLDSCRAGSMKQLVFNLHDLSLMDSDLFRKDETWICDKDPKTGVSSLTCVGKHEGTRSDSNILKSYMANLYGGFPSAHEEHA